MMQYSPELRFLLGNTQIVLSINTKVQQAANRYNSGNYQDAAQEYTKILSDIQKLQTKHRSSYLDGQLPDYMAYIQAELAITKYIVSQVEKNLRFEEQLKLLEEAYALFDEALTHYLMQIGAREATKSENLTRTNKNTDELLESLIELLMNNFAKKDVDAKLVRYLGVYHQRQPEKVGSLYIACFERYYSLNRLSVARTLCLSILTVLKLKQEHFAFAWRLASINKELMLLSDDETAMDLAAEIYKHLNLFLDDESIAEDIRLNMIQHVFNALSFQYERGKNELIKDIHRLREKVNKMRSNDSDEIKKFIKEINGWIASHPYSLKKRLLLVAGESVSNSPVAGDESRKKRPAGDGLKPEESKRVRGRASRGRGIQTEAVSVANRSIQTSDWRPGGKAVAVQTSELLYLNGWTTSMWRADQQPITGLRETVQIAFQNILCAARGMPGDDGTRLLCCLADRFQNVFSKHGNSILQHFCHVMLQESIAEYNVDNFQSKLIEGGAIVWQINHKQIEAKFNRIIIHWLTNFTQDSAVSSVLTHFLNDFDILQQLGGESLKQELKECLQPNVHSPLRLESR